MKRDVYYAKMLLVTSINFLDTWPVRDRLMHVSYMGDILTLDCGLGFCLKVHFVEHVEAVERRQRQTNTRG